MSEDFNPRDPIARSKSQKGEAFYVLTSVIPGASVTIASGALFAINAFQGLVNLDESRVAPSLAYYAFCLGSAFLLDQMDKARNGI